MKKNIGSALALYPMPLAVIGAMSDGKPTWTTVAHMGIIGHDRVLVSLAASHFINGAIKQTGRLSINLVRADMLPVVDLAGSKSGAKADKSGLFAHEVVEDGAPVICDAPLAMACAVQDVYETSGFEGFVCSIDATYVEETFLNERGKIDYATMSPVLFDFPRYEYLSTGEALGPCLSFMAKESAE